MALAIILIALAVSAGAVVALAYYFEQSGRNVVISHEPVTAAVIGSPIQILANVTGPGHNVTLVYGPRMQTPIQVPMNSVTAGKYSYVIPGSQVTGNIAYYIKAYDNTGRELNTTTYQITVADFSLQSIGNTITVYRTKSSSLDVQLLAINNFDGQLQLSTNGNPPGLGVSFSANPVMTGSIVHLNFTAEASTPNGTYPVTVVATYSPSPSSQVTRDTVVDVTVADFQLAVTPLSSTVSGGSTATFLLTLTLQNGFTDAVKITDISGLPAGATYTTTASNPTVLAGGPGTTTLTLQIKVPPSAKPGTYPIVIVAVGGGLSHYQTAQIIVR
jgi:uncharacterized membrane protein